ncbi:P22 phage major capsid protein family protein, partial [Streptomyces sp. NPDC088341]
MANTLLTPDVIAQAALANLYETTVMASLVHRDYEDTFAGAVGDTITIRKPAKFVAQEFNRAAGITVQDATESGIPMSLNHFADVSFAVTSEDLTLKITDFSERLLAPAMEAIAQKIDRDLLALRSDIVIKVGTNAGELWNDPRVLLAAGRELTKRSVPSSQRYAVTGPTMAAEWLKDDLMNRADARGDTQGLIEAAIGRKFGFDTYETNNIVTPTPGAGIPTTEVGVA